MTFGYTIDARRGLIFTRFAGRVCADDLIAALERLWADPAYDRRYEGVADITAVKSDYTIDDVRRVIAFLRDNNRANIARWAVVTADPLAAASAYVYRKTMASVHHVEVFSTLEAAAAFIGWDNPPPSVAPVVV